MNYNEATLHAITGDILMLPGWKGYFYWNFHTNELNFKNGDYYLTSNLLKEKGVRDRNDWYYII